MTNIAIYAKFTTGCTGEDLDSVREAIKGIFLTKLAESKLAKEDGTGVFKVEIEMITVEPMKQTPSEGGSKKDASSK